MVNNSTRILIDHCYFHDKTTEGYFLGFGYDSSNTQDEGPIVEYCRFRNHTSPTSDSGECIGLGASTECRTYFRATIRYCLFDNNTGDGEVVANKSSGNLYYHNSFINNNAALSLRHGD